ncbi:hypothetical protein [Serratia sp. 1D1416]|uniref:hypothetical protein n=1 Tax=Serratia sp. 1D1416 TaxID=2447890 RepID=UPI001013CA8A|nr:hypothetical protein [Serratia sp. 1D1416]
MSDDPLNTIVKSSSEELTRQLYGDVKSFIVNMARKMITPVKKSQAKRYDNIASLLDDLKSNKLRQDSFVALECKPSMFGTFLRGHKLSLINSMGRIVGHKNFILSPDPFLQLMANTTSYLKPVGLYPKIDDEVSQICLYPADTNNYGMMGIMPGVGDLVPSIPAIASQSKLVHSGASSNVIGIVRLITRAMFEDNNIPIEIYEDYRAKGDVWFLDLHSEGTEIKPMYNAATTEVWAGLYAEGHLEHNGVVRFDILIPELVQAFKNVGIDVQYIQNQARDKDFLFWSPDVRLVLYPSSSYFSLHMDAEVNISYKVSRNKFDRICHGVLDALVQSANKCGVKVNNPYDLDFSYTDSSSMYSLLTSGGANAITDPLAIAVRDWHRLKNG